jgi:Flp pilus assembly pilin Flp
MNLRSLRDSQHGTTTVEYLVLMVLILGAFYAGWETFGKRIVAAIAGS